jgi:hypothetical protein
MRKLALYQAPNIDQLGGIVEVVRAGADAATDLYADRMIAAIVRGRTLTPALANIIAEVVERNPHPLVLAAAVFEIKDLELPPDCRRRVRRALLEGAERRNTALEADMASERLAGAFLLATAGHLSRFAVLSHLEESQVGEHPSYLRRAAHIAGLAYACDRAPQMRAVLERLAGDA